MPDVEFQRVQQKGFALKAGVGDEASVGKIQVMCVGESLEKEDLVRSSLPRGGQ